MKIDGHIKKLRLKSMGLRRKRDKLFDLTFENKYKEKNNPYYETLKEARSNLKNNEEEIEFLIRLRRELGKNEMQDKKKR